MIDLPNDIPRYDAAVLGPLATTKTRIMMLSGALNLDALLDRAKAEFAQLRITSKGTSHS